MLDGKESQRYNPTPIKRKDLYFEMFFYLCLAERSRKKNGKQTGF